MLSVYYKPHAAEPSERIEPEKNGTGSKAKLLGVAEENRKIQKVLNFKHKGT